MRCEGGEVCKRGRTEGASGLEDVHMGEPGAGADSGEAFLKALQVATPRRAIRGVRAARFSSGSVAVASRPDAGAAADMLQELVTAARVGPPLTAGPLSTSLIFAVLDMVSPSDVASFRATCRRWAVARARPELRHEAALREALVTKVQRSLPGLQVPYGAVVVFFSNYTVAPCSVQALKECQTAVNALVSADAVVPWQLSDEPLKRAKQALVLTALGKPPLLPAGVSLEVPFPEGKEGEDEEDGQEQEQELRWRLAQIGELDRAVAEFIVGDADSAALRPASPGPRTAALQLAERHFDVRASQLNEGLTESPGPSAAGIEGRLYLQRTLETELKTGAIRRADLRRAAAVLRGECRPPQRLEPHSTLRPLCVPLFRPDDAPEPSLSSSPSSSFSGEAGLDVLAAAKLLVLALRRADGYDCREELAALAHALREPGAPPLLLGPATCPLWRGVSAAVTGGVVEAQQPLPAAAVVLQRALRLPTDPRLARGPFLLLR